MLATVIAAAEAAGRLIEDVRSAGFDVEQKGSQGPVTAADKAADTLLKRELLGIEPCGWLSEETVDEQSRIGLRRVWIVDPLDGTKEFVGGIPEYSVAIALVEDGRAVLGVIHNPATKETFAAERGDLDQHTIRIGIREGNRMLASRSEVKRGEFRGFDQTWDIRSVGSIQYKLALVAAGRANVTLSRGPKWEWDVCAGAFLVEVAGGIATDMFGEQLTFNQPFPKAKGVLAGAPGAHDRALRELSSLGASDRMKELVDGRPHDEGARLDMD